MTTRIARNSDSSFFEALEARALLAVMPPAPDPTGAVPLTGPVQIANDSFLNPAHDPLPAPGSGPADDSDQYDFGSVWGTQPAGTNASGTPAPSFHAIEDDGLVDQDGGRGPRITPADISAVTTTIEALPSAPAAPTAPATSASTSDNVAPIGASIAKPAANSSFVVFNSSVRPPSVNLSLVSFSFDLRKGKPIVNLLTPGADAPVETSITSTFA